MKIFSNIGYYLKEVCKIIKTNLLSNFFSFIGTGLILFLLGLVVTGWGISNQLVETLQKEAEISVYFKETEDSSQIDDILEYINTIDGVESVKLINETEAYCRMQEILGEEAEILELFEENPFESYAEVSIDLDNMDKVIEKISIMNGIDYVRDNREVLEQVKKISEGLKALSYIVIVAVGITTLVIISHLIRQGIYSNKDQINTLRLLGAPNTFIGFPFLMTGLLLTLAGGILATALIVMLINIGYNGLTGTLPFIPLPSKDIIITELCIFIPFVSIILGIMGSLFGLSSIRKNR